MRGHLWVQVVGLFVIAVTVAGCQGTNSPVHLRPRARTLRNNRPQRGCRRSTSSQNDQLRGPPSPVFKASRLL